ncbi:MAG: hypothetical protein KME16_26875 [Scytolyngbya sp. HA4215-MV1]|nr:hypothetical protein [Scytolyngbya sp. HA4215-MV1]
MKVAQYGTVIVFLHAIVHGLHGLAHVQIPVALSLLQIVFIGGVIVFAPMVAAGFLWTKLDRIGYWLLLGAMMGAILFGIYNHFIAISPDHVSQVALNGWGWLFQITAILTLIVDGLGLGLSLWALKAMPQSERVA